MIGYIFSNITDYFRKHIIKNILPYINNPTIGRNQPCPCGSGKKYKLCCLGKKKVLPKQINFDEYFLSNGELAFVPPQLEYYSYSESKKIITHVLKTERMYQKIKNLTDEEIQKLSLQKLSDCEFLVIAEYYLQKKREDMAMEFFAKVAESEEFDISIDYFGVFEELINYWRDKDVDKAIYFLKHRIRKVPCASMSDDPDMDERDLAELYVEKGEREKGIRIFEQLINRNPDNIWNYNCAALCLMDVGEYQLAEKYIMDGISLAKRTNDPENLLPQLKDMLKEVKKGKKQKVLKHNS